MPETGPGRQPPFHIHDDDGTVEGCPGCFYEPELNQRAPGKDPDLITELRPGQVIVIGSNQFGLHISGAALYAHQHFGLRWGVGEGLSGQAYALPTMEGPALLRVAVRRFTDYAELSHDLLFLLTKVGCGIAGYPEDAVSPLFADAPVNVLRPPGWPPYKGKPRDDIRRKAGRDRKEGGKQ